MTKPKARKKLKKRLLHKYRLLILNEDTFEERVSLKLTRLNVFILVGFSAIILIALTTLLIAYTPSTSLGSKRAIESRLKFTSFTSPVNTLLMLA